MVGQSWDIGFTVSARDRLTNISFFGLPQYIMQYDKTERLEPTELYRCVEC